MTGDFYRGAQRNPGCVLARAAQVDFCIVGGLGKRDEQSHGLRGGARDARQFENLEHPGEGSVIGRNLQLKHSREAARVRRYYHSARMSNNTHRLGLLNQSRRAFPHS